MKLEGISGAVGPLRIRHLGQCRGQFLAPAPLLDVGEDLEKRFRPSAMQRLIFV
jgi:hypothetical protein